jgi:hypothetical protein
MKLFLTYKLLLLLHMYNAASPPGAASSVFRGNKIPPSSVSKYDQNNQGGFINFENYDKLNFYDSFISIPDEQSLIVRLLRNYDPAARPVFNATRPVVIKFGFALIQICDMDERNQIFTTNVWLEQVKIFFFY